MRLIWCISGFLLFYSVSTSCTEAPKTLEEHEENAKITEKFPLSYLEDFLNALGPGITIYEAEDEEALQRLEDLDMGLVDISTLFLLSQQLDDKIAAINSRLFEKSIETLSAKEAVLLAYNCYFDSIRGAVYFILNEKFSFSFEKGLLNASHFLYECFCIDADLTFVVYCWDRLSDHTKVNVMYDLVGPDRKSIVQILIENNRADWLSNLSYLVENSVLMSRSILIWLGFSEIVSCPLFWISKDTNVEVLKAYDAHDESFTDSILIHAIKQECKAEVIEFIVNKCKVLKKDAKIQGICPMYLAYKQKSYAIMEVLARHCASQYFFENGQKSSIMRHSVLSNDIKALKILLLADQFYRRDLRAFEIAKEKKNFEAIKLFLTIVDQHSEEEAESIINGLRT